MKKSIFLKMFFIAVTALSFVACLSSISDDDDSRIDCKGAIDNPSLYDHLISLQLTNRAIFLSYEIDSTLPESIIVYLEMHEKSPPSLSA